jgi:hypothetical protein
VVNPSPFSLPLLPNRTPRDRRRRRRRRMRMRRRRRRRKRRRREKGEGGDQFQYSAANNPRISFTLIPSA